MKQVEILMEKYELDEWPQSRAVKCIEIEVLRIWWELFHRMSTKRYDEISMRLN